MFFHNFDYEESRDIHGYNTRRNKDIRKSKSRTNWGQWTTIIGQYTLKSRCV